MKRVKLLICLLLCFAAFCGMPNAWADTLTVTDIVDTLEEAAQFPFVAQTNELAVNIRAEADSKSEKIGRLERGTQLTVTGAEIGKSGELFYCVLLEDGTEGFIRSDLLIEAEIVEAQRAANPAPQASEYPLIGNKKTKKYHEPTCHTLPADKNRVYFESADEAEGKGYVHCKNCD